MNELSEFRATASQVEDFNRIIRFLSVRDLRELNPEGYHRASGGSPRADLLILLGGITTPDFVTAVAAAWKAGLARCLFVVGGSGHSTVNLRRNVAAHPEFGTIATENRSEADMISDLLVRFHDVNPKDILIENRSTNCGNNATFALELIRHHDVAREAAVLVQDPIMQRRSLESFRHAWRSEPTHFLDFTPCVPLLALQEDGELCFADPAHEPYYRMKPFLELVMGEIPRLRDDAEGYGPKGQGFIGHIDIPPEIEHSFSNLATRHPSLIRAKWKGGAPESAPASPGGE